MLTGADVEAAKSPINYKCRTCKAAPGVPCTMRATKHPWNASEFHMPRQDRARIAYRNIRRAWLDQEEAKIPDPWYTSTKM